MSSSDFREEIPRRYLEPCAIFTHRQEHLVTTVLGSCIAVCLWDSVRAMGGMNHYMLPLWNGEGLATPKFGNIAIDRLIRSMQDMGSRPEDLIAKVFGGSTMLNEQQGLFQVGERNTMLAQDLLPQKGIQITVFETGGPTGRKIIFNTHTGAVLMGKIAKNSISLPDGRPAAKRLIPTGSTEAKANLSLDR